MAFAERLMICLMLASLMLLNVVWSDQFLHNDVEVEDDDEHDRNMHPSMLYEPNEPRVTPRRPEELEISFWKDNAQNYLKEIVAADSYNTPKLAKNVILFLGDGMSLATVAAARMYMGGEEKSLSFEKFPHFGLSKTYCVDKQVADSACTSTAYLNGVKANYGTMGINAQVKRGDCKGQNRKETHTESIASWAQKSNKSAGLVTTSRVTHASPGGLYAHIADRDWENDQEVTRSGCNAKETADIARQLIENDVAKKLKVVFGGGRSEFRNSTNFDEEHRKGLRSDGRDLIQEWLRMHNGSGQYVYDKKNMNNLDKNSEFLLGLFSDDHCEYNGDIQRKNLQNVKPTLSEMTKVAIEHLQKEKGGFFLFVESARIDMAHHENWARIAMEETEEFSKTIEMARKMTNISDTLIVVTSDHAHTMTYNGYPKRGRNVLGLSGGRGTDKLPYPTLSYANGKGYYNAYKKTGGRIDLTTTNFSDPRLQYIATVPLDYETHGGEDVGIYASGPRSELFVGNYEQSFIPMLMAHASQIGPYRTDESSSATKCVATMTITSIILSIALSYFL